MKARWTCLLGLTLGLVSGQAFVLDLVSPKGPRRWDLVTPEAHLSGGAFIPVSTNVVNPATRAVRFYLAADAWSATNATAELNAVRAAFGQWQAIPHTIVKFEEGGVLAAGTQLNPDDDTNVVFWAKSGAVQDNLLGTLAVTYFSALDDIQTGADIVVNGKYAWFTDFDRVLTGSDAQFIESTVGHEIGHFLGLNHSPLGAGSMFWRGMSGVNAQTGLSSDEVAAAQRLYPAGNFLATLGRITGQVTMGGRAVFAAVAVAEDASGNAVEGTVSWTDGVYDLPGLPPGTYTVRIAPLDPGNDTRSLSRGANITPDFASAQTAFQPSASGPITVTAGQTQTLNVAVIAGAPAFHLNYLLKPNTSISPQTRLNGGVDLQVGRSNIYIGVYGLSLPVDGSTLTLTGNGITATVIHPATEFFDVNLVALKIDVSPLATPGLRTLILQHGNDLAFAHGFLKIRSQTPDFNFDGLDDHFQRRYFPLWTAPAAAPAADPDGDGFNNYYESKAGSDPANAASFPTVDLDQITWALNSATLRWLSVPGAQYQVFGRDTFSSGSDWSSVGPVLTAVDTHTLFTDSTTAGRTKFYRVRILPTPIHP